MKIEKKRISIIELLFLVLLAIYPLRHISMGVDLMDGGYSYANFTFSGPEYMDSMWFFATWSANILGSFLTGLPWGNTMLGMNFYTALLVSIMAIAGYVFCTRKLKLSKGVTFVGEMVALSLCWLPTAVLYTYLTYGLFMAGVIFLYRGLIKEKRSFLVMAGVCLGWNVSVRFSNLPQMALILAVWYYAIINKKKVKTVLQETGLCILGYLAALVIFFVLISLNYGIEEYIEGIKRLFTMTEYATDYATDSLLWGMVGGYFGISYWIKRCILAVGAAFLVCIIFPTKWIPMKKTVTIFCMLALLWWFKKSGFFVLDYASYYSVYYPCVLLLLTAMGLALFQMADKTVQKEEKLLALMVILLILLTSFGSNNAIFSTMNNLFLIMPCFWKMAIKFVEEKKHILFFPFQMFLVLCSLLLLVQSAKFGWRYVYEEADGARDLSVKVSQIPVLKGIHTGNEKAKALEDLYLYLQKNGLQERECILYGDIPGIAYYMELKPANNIWSDLRSYSPETMLKDMETVREGAAQNGNNPIVIVHQKYAEYCKNNNKEVLPEEVTVQIKLDFILDFIEEKDYSLLYENAEFMIWGR